MRFSCCYDTCNDNDDVNVISRFFYQLPPVLVNAFYYLEKNCLGTFLSYLHGWSGWAEINIHPKKKTRHCFCISRKVIDAQNFPSNFQPLRKSIRMRYHKTCQWLQIASTKLRTTKRTQSFRIKTWDNDNWHLLTLVDLRQSHFL